jgi:hypothetical protein
MVPGGSCRQWIHLLAEHVQAGGQATIVAPPGPLVEPAQARGIEVLAVDWSDGLPQGNDGLWHLVGGHDAAVVQWEQHVMGAFAPALSACGRAALVLHQAPEAMPRWFGPAILPAARSPLVRAIGDRRAVALVRGASHRRRVADAFDLDAADLDILPASIPLASIPFRPAPADATEILALTRLSPEKAPIAQLAVALTKARLSAGRPCRLTIAGEGPWRGEAEALCLRHLPFDNWRIEEAPPDPIACLAAAEVVVAQGLTTLEAAALGRRVVIARAVDEHRAAGAVLTPSSYESVARDPFGRFPPTEDAEQLWKELLALDGEDLRAIRALVETHNSIEAASRALANALAATAAKPAGRLPETA